MPGAARAPRRPLALIVCRARNRVIGREGRLPWHYPEDLRYFKRTTSGRVVIAGRRTHEAIGRPLPGRRNLVITRRAGYEAPGCEVFHDLPSALAAAYETDACPFVIGGAEVYAQTLPFATHLYETEVLEDVEGDAFFPAVHADDWRVTAEEGGEHPALVFRLLERSDE
jgi:dihydrofolate reductase